MKDAVTILPNTLILVWWDGQAIATVNGNTEGVIKAIEQACRKHSCFNDVKLIRPVSINLDILQKETLSVTINDGVEEYEGDVELTAVSNYHIIHK